MCTIGQTTFRDPWNIPIKYIQEKIKISNSMICVLFIYKAHTQIYDMKLLKNV